MEHIRQCSKEHAPGSFDVAEDITCLGSVANLGAISILPFLDEPEKLVFVFPGADTGHLEEDIPELSSVGSLGETAAPDQPLPLDVDQAALHGDTRPRLLTTFVTCGLPSTVKLAGRKPSLISLSKNRRS